MSWFAGAEAASRIAEKQGMDLADLRFTAWQNAWLHVAGRFALLRGANQIGKSLVQAADIVLFARGKHPQQTHPAPVRIMVVSYSWEQMDPLLEKIWMLLPKDEIDPKCYYQAGNGIRGYKNPHVRFIRGPGKDSIIYFATYKQGSKRIAGGSFHRVYLDEPPPDDVYGEIVPRLNRYQGRLRVTFTPTPESPPLEYLREKVEKGEVAEIHVPLTVEAVTPRGGLVDRPWMNEQQIADFESQCLPIERDMRVRGGWEVVYKDRAILNYGPHCVYLPNPPAGALLGVGIDHGSAAAGKQASVLVAIDVTNPLFPRVWALGEYHSDGTTTHEQDAKGILTMLEESGFSYWDVDFWVGDRATTPNTHGVIKNNRKLLQHIAKLLNVDTERLKAINTPYKYQGSVTDGMVTLNNLAGRKDEHGRAHLCVAPHLIRLKESLEKHKGHPKDPLKDALDAFRYVVEKALRIDRQGKVMVYIQ